MEFDKKCILDVNGVIEKGTQYDLDIVLPEDNRDVVYGIVKDCFKEPIKDAVVKLIEVCKDERKPVSHTFTDKDGEFVFGPLCPNKKYAIEIWVDRVDHVKICKVCKHEGRCLKGIDLDCDHKHDKDCDCRHEHDKDCEHEHDKDKDCECKHEHDKDKDCDKHEKDY